MSRPPSWKTQNRITPQKIGENGVPSWEFEIKTAAKKKNEA